MTRFTAFVILIVLRISFNPSNAQNVIAPFSGAYPNDSFRKDSPLPASAISITQAKLISITGSIRNNKVILDWVVGQNETADKFEVEKSTDGKTFTLAALVFGTDKPETDNYMFYEKAGKKKILFRIKIISKTGQAAYSDIIEINPTT